MLRAATTASVVAGSLGLTLLGVVPPGAGATPAATPGAPGLGDRMFPLLGNGGYDVGHYDLAFAYTPATRTFQATAEVTATATQSLSRFDLDFAGNTVRQVMVQGHAAHFAREGEELVVTPATPVPRGRRFRTVVVYTGTPAPYQGADPGGTKGFFPTADGFFVAPQPQAAHSVFPADDHPSDKATITYRLTVPTGLTAAANGSLTGIERHGPMTTWVWREREPIATELVTIAVGDYGIHRHTGPGGLPLRDVAPAADLATLRPWLDRTSEHLVWLRRRLGRYPFSTYGLLVVPGTREQVGFAEENQTLTVMPEWVATSGYPDDLVASAEVHELTHQWFGDSVSPRRWSDVWLNEGPAVFYAALYTAEHGGLSLSAQAARWYYGDAEDHVPGDQERRDLYGPPGAPGSARTLYSDSVYNGGALVLYALRRQVGEHAFDAIMRTWVSAHRYGDADTAEFVRTATAVSGRDVGGLLNAWLLAPTTPPLAGLPPRPEPDQHRYPPLWGTGRPLRIATF